jgi:hypothetical protein
MNPDETPPIDATIQDALRREHELMEMYEAAIGDAGYDVSTVFAELLAQSHTRVAKLEQLQDTLENFHLLWSAMVD